MTFGTPPRLVAAGTFALAVAAALTDVAAGQTPPPSVYLPPEATPPVAAVPAAAPLSPAAASLAPATAPLAPAPATLAPAPGRDGGPAAGPPLQLPPAPLSRGDAAAYPLAALDAASAAGWANEPAVRVWLEQWQARVEQGGATTAADAAALAAALAGTTLPCLALDGIRRATQVAEPDLPAERLHPWVHATVVRAAAELAGVNETDPQAAAAAAPIVRAAQEAPGLWDRRDGVALEKQADVLVRFLPRGSEAWGWARVQQASSLYVQGSNDLALSALDRLATSADFEQLPAMPRVELAWTRGLTRYVTGRYAEATAHLREAMVAPHHHAEDASRLLIVALAHSGQTDEARRQFQTYVGERRPSQQAIRVLWGELRRLQG
ncbi:MAG TPA: hypothetical protein VK324_17320 [Tepidisphaeraceae bacterium]|nr:hypothetical protein [Tepidisphaeraceae bacterium]